MCVFHYEGKRHYKDHNTQKLFEDGNIIYIEVNMLLGWEHFK